MTIDPGALAVAIAISSRLHDRGEPLETVFFNGLALVGILVVMVTVWLCYRYASWIFDRLGDVGLDIVARLSAFILMAVGVEIIWEGLSTLIIGLNQG